MDKLAELKRLKELLQIEKDADLEYFKTVIQNKPLEQRRAEGFTWYPLSIKGSGYTYGDRAFVTVERGGSADAPHQFRSGNVVNFFTQQKDVYRAEFSGTIQFISKNEMRIILNAKDLPDWMTGGSIGVDLLFDDRTYMEMERALTKVIDAKGDRLAELRDIFLNLQKQNYVPNNSESYLNLEKLNASQNKAVQNIIQNRDVAIIHGPPGTGKTTTIVAAVKKLTETESTVLVAAPSNTAADLLTERLATEGLLVVRVGNISRVDESIVKHTLESQIANHPEAKNIKKIKIKAAELRRQARTFKRKFDFDARSKRDELKDEAKDVRLRVIIAEDEVHFLARNGVRSHEMIVRRMIGGPGGVELKDGKLAVKESIPLAELKTSLADYLKKYEESEGIDFPAKPLDLKRLHVVAFVQNDESHEVLQTNAIAVTAAETAAAETITPAAGKAATKKVKTEE